MWLRSFIGLPFVSLMISTIDYAQETRLAHERNPLYLDLKLDIGLALSRSIPLFTSCREEVFSETQQARGHKESQAVRVRLFAKLMAGKLYVSYILLAHRI